jgi:hypothetical protein
VRPEVRLELRDIDGHEMLERVLCDISLLSCVWLRTAYQTGSPIASSGKA